MTTIRQSAREAAAAALSALNRFYAVKPHAVRALGGQSPLAVAVGRRQRLEGGVRGGAPSLADCDLLLTLYVRCDLGTEADAENLLDTLTSESLVALAAAGFEVGETEAMPSNAILHDYDGILYRVERVPLTWRG